MKASIIRIGNSRGIRIPKVLLQQCSMENEVILETKGSSIIIKPKKDKPRREWEKAFKEMGERKEDRLIIDDTIDLDTGDWDW